jgi:hypothetical protein
MVGCNYNVQCTIFNACQMYTCVYLSTYVHIYKKRSIDNMQIDTDFFKLHNYFQKFVTNKEQKN